MAGRFLIVQAKSDAARTMLRAQIKILLPLLSQPDVDSGHGPLIFTSEDCPFIDGASGHELILGHLFSRGTTPLRLQTLPRDLGDAITRTKGDDLLRRCWGGYVAVIQDGSSLHLIRDPSGALPCYYAETEDAFCFASDIDLLHQTGLKMMKVDWDQLLRHLVAFDLREPRTALSGVTELMPGFRLTLANSAVTLSKVWSPWDYIEPTPDLADDLRTDVTHSLQTWAGCFNHILLNVSGGLDSSIAAAALQGAKSVVTCLNMRTDEAEGDERRYARCVTEALEWPLIEAQHRFEDVDIRRTGSAHLPRPVLFALGQSEAAQKLNLVAQYHIDALFTGIGGDNVFCNMQSATPIVDRLRHEGLNIGLLRTFIDVCDLTEASFSEVLKATFTRWRKTDPTYIWHTDHRFLNPDRIQNIPPPSHPWLVAEADSLPGKAAHIAMLVRIQATIDSRDRAAWPQQVHPLLSQPIVERCLAIPTWRWIAGGRNRSVARQAFSPLLPPAIIQRKSKGSPTSFAYRLVCDNKAILREHLLGGLLVQNGILDPITLSNVLSDQLLINGSEHLRILMLAEAEAWARHHSG